MIFVTILAVVFMLTKCGDDPYWPEDTEQTTDGGTEEKMIGFLPKVYYNYKTEDVEVADRWDHMPEMWLFNAATNLVGVTEPDLNDDDFVLLYFIRRGCPVTAGGMRWVEDIAFDLYWNHDIAVTVSAVAEDLEQAEELGDVFFHQICIGAPYFFDKVEKDKHLNEVRGYPQLFILTPHTNEIIGTIAGRPKDLSTDDYIKLILGRIQIANDAKFYKGE